MATNKPFIIRVAIQSPLRQLFDYVIPKTILEISPNQQPTSGCRVLVPFGRRLVVGLIVTCPETTDYDENKLKSIENLLDKSPLIPQELFALFVWAAHYYQHPIGDALFNMLPVTLRKAKPLSEPSTKYWQLTAKGKGLGENSLNRAPSQKALIGHLLKHGRLSQDDLIRLFPRNILHTLAKKDLIKDSEDVKAKVAIKIVLKQVPLSLNTAQKIVFAKIRYDDFRCYLLNGVTGSGKTEIYLRAIEDVLRQGKQALVLIPEISLTPQTQKRFSDRFNVPIVTLHSGLSDKARLIAWTDAKAGRASIVLGTRSAIFTPLEQPGLIVVDEEHDQSYKQQEGFRYSARDLAVIRARKENIPIILGSATPSIESLNNCVTKRA
jgi:primosomal protein N' (replication factor Y)